MGDDAAPIPTALRPAPPPPPPLPIDGADKGEKPKAADGGAPPPGPVAPPPNEQELKKITSEVTSAGVKLPKELLDEKGNIKPDQVAAAKKFIAEEAAKRKGKDLGAAARLYQRALKLDPEDKQLRVDAAKTTKAWADTQKKPEVKKALLGEAVSLLKPGKEDKEEIGLLGDYARELASLHLRDGKPAEARQVLATAAPKLSVEELDKTYAFLSAPENADMLEEGQYPWMFLGDALMQGKNYELAAIAYTRGVNVAHKDKNFPLRDEFNNKFSLAHEAEHPYPTEFADPATGQVSNAAANAFFRSLQAQGVPASAMDKEVDGKSDLKISAKEVYAYIGEHLDDPRVQAVLAMAKINIAEQDKSSVKIVGFGLWMSDHYTKEAERLKKEDSEKNAPGIAKLLTFAADLDPENPKRAETLGDFYAEQKAYPLAMQAYAEAAKAYKAMPPPDKNPRAMEGFVQTQEEAAKRLKGKIDDMFEKSLQATGQAYEREGTDLSTKLQLAQTLEGQYEIFGELYPDEVQRPDRIRQMGLTYNLIAQNLEASGKRSEAKAYYAKAVEKYQAAINANKNDAVFCIQTYKMMGDANHKIGDYKAALISYSMAAQCQKLRIRYRSGDQLPTLASVKQDRAPGQLVFESSLGNYVHSDVHDIRSVDGLDALPHWAEGPRENYINQLKAQIDGGPAARQVLREQNPPDLQKIYDSLEAEAKLLSFFRRDEEAKKIGEEAAQAKTQLDHQKLSAEVEALGKADLLDKKGLDAVTDRENKGQATALKFSDYVQFERSGNKVTFKFTQAYEKLDIESQNRVMHAMMSAAQRNQISRSAEKAKGPAKLFYEGQLAIFDEDRVAAKSKFEQFSKEAKGTQDPVLLRMLQQTEGVMQILEKDGKQKPSDVMRDLRVVLAPLAMTLKPGQDGGLDLSAISKTEVKSFEDFRQYLASQVSVDGVNFNAAIFASYEKVLKSPKHEALLKHLYAEFNSEAAGDAPQMTTEQLQAALRDFQRDIIDVSPGRFVGNQLSNKEGRGRLRALLSDETLDRGIRAKLCEEIVEQGQAKGYASSAMVVAFDEKVNTYGFWLQEGKLDTALRYGFRVLDAGDHEDVTRNAHVEKYEKYPQEIQRLQSDNLDHSVTPKSIQDMAKMVQAQSGKSDGVSIMRAKLGTMWLTVVDNDSWGVSSTVDRHKSYVKEKQRAEMANALHSLLSEADKIGTEQEFLAWSQRVRRFMRGQGSGKKDDLAATAGEYLGKGAEDLVGEAGEKLSWAVSDTAEDAFKGLKPSVAHSYNDLLRYVDEIHVSNLHGMSVEVLDPDVSVTDPAQKEKTVKLIQELRGMKRGFWYNYQQRNFLSRSMSEQGNMVGVGDIASIDAANKEIDGIVADLQKAKTTEDFEKIKARMTRATREGGAIHKGFADSEMEGTEQVINLVQTIAEIVVITVATQGIGTEAALGRAAATFGQTALRTRNLRMAYQAFSEVRSVANMARAAETLEMANMARYGSLYREMQGVGRLGALAGEDAMLAKGFQSVFARSARAIGGEVGFASKAAGGFKMGATISLTENMIGSLSGQLKTDPTTLLDWLKDATATGLSMVVSAGLSPTVGEQVQQNIVKGLWQRYVAGGAKSAVHFLADTGLEVIEEVVDNYVRKKLDGDFSKLSFDELRDITMVCFIGGVKQGVTSHFTNFTKAKVADYQVKKLQQGFSERGERVVQDPKRGYVLVDREGRYLKKVDGSAMQAFLVFDVETHGDGAGGIALVEFESGEKGTHGKPVQVEVDGFPEVRGEAPPKSADAIKKENEENASAQGERSVEKAKNAKQRKLYGQFLEKGDKVEEVKRNDGVVIGLALVDSKGKKLRDATVDELAAYQRYAKLVEGFETRKEKVFGNQAQGFYLADAKGKKIGDAGQADLSLYLKFKKRQATAELRTNMEAAQKKAYDEREAVRLGEYEAGYGYRLKKRNDGVTLGVEKFDARSGKAVEADKTPTKEDLESYQAWTTQREVARGKTEAETKLKEGFAEGQQIVLNADTGKYELQDAKGKKLRVATDAEQKLYSDFQVRKQQHEAAIGKRAEVLSPDFESGVVIRPQVKKADTYEKSNANEANAAAFEGADGKVSYYVKVKPDGSRERPTQKEIRDFRTGKAPKDEVVGFEKVDKEGKVIDGPPIPKDDYEAYQHWYTQKKEAAKVVVLKAVEPPVAAVAEGGKPGDQAPKKGADADPAMTRAADAGHAFDLSFDHAMRSGKPPTTEELTQVVQRNMESLSALQPALDGLPKAKRQAVKDGILQQLADGKLTKDQAVELAAKIAKGEAEIVPNAKAEYGYEVKVKEAPKPKADEVTKTDPAAKQGAGDAADAGPVTQRDGAKGKKQAEPPQDPVLEEGVRRVLEAQSGRAQWELSLKRAEDHGTPKDKAAAKEVRTAADNVKSLSGEYLKAKAELKKHAEGSPERLAAQKRVDELRSELRKNLDLIQKWEDYPKERSKFTVQMRDAAFPFLERAIQGQGHDKGLGDAPEGTRILDVSFRQPAYGDDFQAGPGKSTGEYEVLIHVRTEADAQAVLKEARLNHGENKAQFVKDADGKVRSVEMTTPDGRVFSVRVELATTENRAEVTDRGGIAGASHEGVGYKEYNEDRQVVVTFENGRTVTLVIDGMGGTQGGEMAAKLAKTAFEKAVKEGKSVEDGIRLANEAVAAYGKELLPALTERLMKEQELDRATAEHYAKYMLPGAVAMGTEISRNPNGTYNARFRSVGDCEAAVIRFKPNGEVEILDAYGRSEADILKSRSDPNANIVDQSLGGHSGPLKIRTKDVTVEKGDIVLNGSDGFFENFGSHTEIAFLIKQSGAKSPAEVRDVLMREVLIRQQLADTLQKSGQENMALTPEAYAKAYQAVTGQEPPAGWKGMWEGKVLDMMGNVGEAKDLGRVQVTYADGQSFEFRGVPRDKTQSHFKKDNTTLVVQGVGEAVRPDTVTPSRAELAKEQMGLALELARSFGLEKNADFMKDLNALVMKDVASGGRTQDAAGREALLRQRVKDAKALAERYGMDKNPAFLKLLGRLVVDNLREAELRFGEAPKQGATSDPKLTGFMERQRGYGLKLAKGFEAKVDPAKREKFKMDLGKILSQDAAGLPSGGDPAIEAKFKTNREAVVEALAKEYGLDGDANFMKAAKMLLVDRVLKECPRVEPKGPKVDPVVRQTGQRLESEIYDRALRAGRNKEEAAQIAKQARGHFDAALKEGKKPEEAFAAASEKMAAEFKETVRPGAAAPKELPPAERETVRPGKAQAGDKQALTPSGVRSKGSPVEETTGELKTEVDHLAAGDTPFAPAARELQAGKITLTEYRARQKQVAEKMVEDHKAAYEDVMGFLTEVGKDPALGISQEFPPKGRMKAADDLAPKLVRRGWQDMAPLTDVAGTRIVVRSNADAEAVIARIQEKYKIREAYLKDGSMEADLMTPAEMKSKGIKEEEGVVWIDAKLDQDGIHRLVDGHPASGYRALHIVVEVDGKPVEIQIKTEAMHEWGEIEHKLVYKNKDLPPEVMDPIKKFRQEASDYLAKVTHREAGEKLPEMPKPPELPTDVPNRGEIQRGLDDMVSLMKKYSEGEPGGGQVLQIPKAPKAPDVEGINRKVAYLNGLYERIFPEPVGRPGLKNMDLVGELDMIRERLVEGGHQALLEKFDADYKALMTEPTDSPQFKVAIERLGDVLALNHGDPRFRQPVVFMTEPGFAEFAKASQEVYDKSSGPASGAKEGKGADVIPLRPKAKSDMGTETRKAADSSDPERLTARLEAKNADPNKALEPLLGIEKRLETAEPELAAQLKADRETILKGDKNSPEYQDALQRMDLLDAALRGPLEYGKELSDKSVADLVRPLYVEKGSDSQGPKGSGRDSNTGTLATGTGLLMGLLALVAPETARAADGVMRGGPNMGPVEIAMIVGIGTLLAIPVVRRFLSAPKPSTDLSPATRDNPVRLEHNGVVTAIRPLETRDYQGGRVVDGFVGTFSKEGSKVHGDGVELVYRVTDPSSGTVTANTKVYLSKTEAQRLGVKFDAKGTQVVEVPNHGFVVKQYAVGTPANVNVAADAGPRGGSVVANHAPLEVSAGTTYFQVMADAQGRPVVNQYMGQVSPPLLTFQRGPKGQWYVFEGKPSMDFYAAQADPVARRYWKPVKDGDLFQVGNSVVPFKAPPDAWIQYQMPDGSVQGYAPPAASGGAPPIAVSGKLPVGEARTVVPKVDGSPFVIGRGQGDLQFTDSNVSGVHATIVRNQADGKWYLVDGPMGDASTVSTNGVYVMGGRMPKYHPIRDGEYFVINGATFQFREPAQAAQAAPPAPPAPQPPPAPVAPSDIAVLQAGPHGGPAIDLGGRSFTVSPWQQGWTEMGTQYLGRIASASRVPNDPQGKVRLDVRTRRGMGTEEGRITLEMTPAEAAALNIKLRPDGTLQPGPKEPYLSFGEIMPQPVALAAADANPNPVVPTRARPQPPPLPPRRGPVDLKDGAGQAYQLEGALPTEGLVPGKLIGTVTRLEPLPGNSGGKLWMVVELRTSFGPDAPAKTVSFSVTPQEAARLGLKLDPSGRLAPGSAAGLKVTMPAGEVGTLKPKPAVPGEVQGVWADNAPGAPRRGEVGKKEATEVYGTSAGKTHEGIGYKAKNEDAVVQGENFAVVLDGMGGHKGGDAASRISGEAIAKYISEHQGKMPPEELLTKALLEGDRAVKASEVYRQAPEKKKPGAVGVIHLVVKNPDGSHDVYLAHVGDAGAIVVGKDGKVKHRTADQSLLHDFYKKVMSGELQGEAVEAYMNFYPDLRSFYEVIQKHGKDPERMEMEIRAHPYANIVSGGLGTSGDPKPIVQKFRLEPGDKVVMFSDGVGDANATADLAKVAHESKSAKEASDRIMDGTLERMADLEDAMAELPPGKRLPIVRSDGEIAYVDNKGNIYKTLAPEPGEKVLDHYKADNATVHVYFHDPKAGGSDPGKPGPGGGVKESGVRLKPPPLPPGAKQAPKVEAVKPENDIDFKSLPPESLLTQDELAGLDRLNKRPHVKEILHDPTLRPVTKVTVGDQTFYLSRVIETVDERGEVRPHVLALVPVKENGQTVLKRRFFYKSNSDGGWRASPYILGGKYAKGVGKHYTQETQPIPELGAHFQKLEEAAGGVTKVRMTGAEFDKYVDVGSPLLNQDAQNTMLAGFGKEVIFPSSVGMTNIGALQPGAAFKAGAYSGASDPTIVPKLANLTYPEGFIPDFSQAPAKTYTETHTLLGKIDCREFQGGYLVEKGSGRKRPVIWTMAEDGQGRTWVKSIRYMDSKVNSYGVYDEVIDSGIITSKPLEYAEQSYKLPAEYRPDFNGQYVDITPALNALKPIREYRASRGLPNPELPKAPGDPVPPPPQTPKVVQSQIQGLSGTEGKWVYRMDPNTAQVILGREVFMGEKGTEGVSGKHVRIFRSNGTTFIEDSVSMNGSQVWRDNKLVWSSAGRADAMKSIFPIRPGDKIFMGGVEVTFNPA